MSLSDLHAEDRGRRPREKIAPIASTNDGRVTEQEEVRIARAIDSLGITVIQSYEQRERPADYHSKRRTNKPRPKNPFPSRPVLKRIFAMPIEIEGENGAVADPPGTQRPRVLSFAQFRTLYEAISSSSGWWPLADTRWDSTRFFSRLEKYVMYLDQMPIGFGALERQCGAADTTRIVFVGITSGMQGYRFGNYLFNFINHLAWEGGTQLVVLGTAPEFDRMKGAGKPEQSAAKMYVRAGFTLVRTDIIDARTMAISGTHLETLNLPSYYKDQLRFGWDSLSKRLCEEFHCRQPYLPSRAKGR